MVRKQTFGEFLRARRLEAGLGLRAFAEAAEMQPSNLSNIEHGRISPPQDREILERLADLLNLPEGSPERATLFDLAVKGRDRLPADVAAFAARTPGIPVLLRTSRLTGSHATRSRGLRIMSRLPPDERMTDAPAIPQYDLSSLEDLAHQILANKFPEGVSIPIDIDQLVESEPGVTLDIVPDVRGTCGVAGAVLAHPDEGAFTIIIDTAVADGIPSFYRFYACRGVFPPQAPWNTTPAVRTLDDAVALQEHPKYPVSTTPVTGRCGLLL